MSAELLASLASTRPEARTTALLRAGFVSRRLLLLKSLLTRMDREAIASPSRRRLHQDWRLLEEAERRDPRAARWALTYPSVGSWLTQALGIAYTEGESFAEYVRGFGAVAASAALHAGLPFRTTLPTRDGLLTFPGIGAYATRARQVRVIAGPGSLRLTPCSRRTGVVLRPPYGTAAAAGWQGLRPLPGSTVLLDDAGLCRDRSPGHRAAGAHHVWSSRWRAALALLDGADPDRREETTSLVRCIVPRPPGDTASATLGSAPWGLLAALPASGSSLASALVHEVQHSKLATLCDLVPLIVPGGPAVHRVPWRADPRPLGGVLQGTYAHLALADLWSRRARRSGSTAVTRSAARRRAAEYCDQVGDALLVLRRSGELTYRGEEFILRMAEYRTVLAAPPAVPPPRPRTDRKQPGSSAGDVK